MQLKWLRIRFRGRRETPRLVAALGVVGRGRSRDNSALLWGAGQRQLPLAQKVGREVPLHSCRERTAVSPAVRGRLRRVVNFHACSAGPFGPGRLCPFGPRGGDCLAVSVDGQPARSGGRPRRALQLLVLEWLHPTRLETRTKECNMRASLGVTNPSAQ